MLTDLSREFTYDEVLDLVRAVPPVAKPGTTYHYSNANTIVLGAMLQRVRPAARWESSCSAGSSGRSVCATRSTVRTTSTARARVTFHGLFDVSGTGTPIDIGAFPRTAALTVDPAGAGLFSTVPDLLTFTHALFGTSRLLPRDLRTRLARSVSTVDARDLLLGRRFDVHGHGGVSPGAQVMAAYDARSRTTVVGVVQPHGPRTERAAGVRASRRRRRSASPPR